MRRGERPPASAACWSAVEVGCILPMVAAAARVSRGAAHGGGCSVTAERRISPPSLDLIRNCSPVLLPLGAEPNYDA